MFAEANKAMVRRYIEEVWNRHNIDAVDELVSTDYLNHAASAEHQRGFAGAQHVLNWLFAVFPDHRFDIEEAVADGGRWRYGVRAAARTRASSGAYRLRASVSPASSRTGSASMTARWRSIGRSETIWA